MIFRYVRHNSYLRSESFYIIELETADLRYIPFTWIGCYLSCKRKTDVSDKRSVELRVFAYVPGQCCRRGFTVTSCNGNDPTVSLIPVTKFDFTDDFYTFLPYLFHHLVFLRNARAFNYEICFEYL